MRSRTQSTHLINKQVIEVTMPNRAEVFSNQQQLSKLYRERLLPIMDRHLHARFGRTKEAERALYQIEQLTVDLGVVRFQDIEEAFEEKFQQALAGCDPVISGPVSEEKASQGIASTPERVVSYYLANGVLPWWAEEQSKRYLWEQLEAMLEKPGNAVKAWVEQLRNHKQALSRLINTFTEGQLLRVLQLVTTVSLKDLPEAKKTLERKIGKTQPSVSASAKEESTSLHHAFWTAAFRHVAVAQDVVELTSYIAHQLSQHFGMHEEAPKGATGPAREVGGIRQIIANLKGEKIKRESWSHLLGQVRQLSQHHSFEQQELKWLLEFKKLVQELEAGSSGPLAAFRKEAAQKQEYILKSLEALTARDLSRTSKKLLGQLLRSMAHEDPSREHPEALGVAIQALKKEGEVAPALGTLLEHIEDWLAWEKTGPKKQEKWEELYQQSLMKKLHQLEAAMSHTARTQEYVSSPITAFEETDSLYVGNAGLVILWPFLPRFFENMGLVAEKEFHDTAARHKAMCALQYLVDEEEEALFEGALPLNKILCGVPLAEPVEPVGLDASEKKRAEELLHATIIRVPIWKNLTPQGLRSGYLCREGLLKSRDGNWLLQVKKETYDVTLEKLPWGFRTIKLPWMNKILIVEWM